jgi:hypothetical protein
VMLFVGRDAIPRHFTYWYATTDDFYHRQIDSAHHVLWIPGEKT